LRRQVGTNRGTIPPRTGKIPLPVALGDLSAGPPHTLPPWLCCCRSSPTLRRADPVKTAMGQWKRERQDAQLAAMDLRCNQSGSHPRMPMCRKPIRNRRNGRSPCMLNLMFAKALSGQLQVDPTPAFFQLCDSRQMAFERLRLVPGQGLHNAAQELQFSAC
jgi:hypothetical protein